ncbi:MAG: hypothetical protein E7460_11280, partial [Ruminococcaceae bacterium]|nr:hypothetical protein [Oscillospiraceae bacterium]
MSAKWIWLDKKVYPQYQSCLFHSCQSDKTPLDPAYPHNFCVAELKKTVELPSVPQKVKLRVSGDAVFRLWVNGEFIGLGPASAGGDFLCNKEPLEWYYANNYELTPGTDTLELRAIVRIGPHVLTEYSHRQGGFFLEGRAVLENGEELEFGTDETWQIRRDGRYTDYQSYDGSLTPDEWMSASETGDARELTDARLLPLAADTVYPSDPAQRCIPVKAGDV